MRDLFRLFSVCMFPVVIISCGGGDSGEPVTATTPAEKLFAVTATVTGLEGDSVEVALNNTESITTAANESFTFLESFVDGAAYSVTVLAQPSNPSQLCSVTNGSGKIDANGAEFFNGGVNNIEISCVTVLALASVNGEWNSNCVVANGVTSKKSVLNNSNGAGQILAETFSDTACSVLSSQQGAEYTYSLGGTVTVNGTVGDITTATKIDTVFTSGLTGSEFNIIAIKDSNTLHVGMYVGDGSATAELRPTQLDSSTTYTRAP